jgi:cytochrome c oxidase subunit 2
MGPSTTVVNKAFIYIMGISILLFIAMMFLMVFFVVRYRRSKNPEATEIPGNWKLETLWIVVPLLIVITMFFQGLAGFNFLRRPPEGALHVKVSAHEWAWLFEYDNGAKSADLVVPAGKPIVVTLNSEDVIHSFYVPALRVKQDIVPGITTKAWFEADTTGTFDILCAEYCGEGHSSMRALLYVLPQEQFDEWYANQKP